MSGFDGECKGGPYHGQTKAYPHEQMPVYWQEGAFVHTGMYTFIGSKWRYSGPPYRAPTSPLTRPKQVSEHNEFNPQREYPGSYGELQEPITSAPGASIPAQQPRE